MRKTIAIPVPPGLAFRGSATVCSGWDDACRTFACGRGVWISPGSVAGVSRRETPYSRLPLRSSAAQFPSHPGASGLVPPAHTLKDSPGCHSGNGTTQWAVLSAPAAKDVCQRLLRGFCSKDFPAGAELHNISKKIRQLYRPLQACCGPPGPQTTSGSWVRPRLQPREKSR